ncbi:hypothetical protein TWF696_004471 [Orbilia brochopaga]|uniref:Uncharacterized protein n=1 Tax=Orbilia brochopaga TaxID=3140254 RepID=A0AAV9V9I7_9PEZI
MEPPSDLSSLESCTVASSSANSSTADRDHRQKTQVGESPSDIPIINTPPSISRKPVLTIDTTRGNYASAGANANGSQPSLSVRSAYLITRMPSFRAPPTPSISSNPQQQQQPEYDPFNYLLCPSSAYRLGGGSSGCPRNASTTSLRSISCTPTTENLARRMGGHPSGPCHAASRSGSSFDFELCSPRFPLTGDGSLDGFQPGDPGKSNSAVPQSPTKSTGNASTHSLNSFGEEGTLTKMDLVSYLPKIPAASTTASEEERLAKWGPGVGPPQGGSVYKNPYNYEVLEAYSEQEDHPMYNVTESTRRAGNAAIQTMFDPLYALQGLDGRIPRGFPLYGFAMREMPTANLHAVLHAYGIVPVEGVGYEIDRQNMSLLCAHLGATWMSGVI